MDVAMMLGTVAAVCGGLSALAGAASALAAFRAIKSSDSNHADAMRDAEATRQNKQLLDHAITTLERAYSTFEGGSPEAIFPPRIRLNWLTSARLIEDYKKTKARIIDPLLMQECISHETYWQHKFYTLLDPISLGSAEYFKQQEIDSIDLTSAVIIADFAIRRYDANDLNQRYQNAVDAAEEMPVHLKWASLRYALEHFEE
ncbi:hypothetical protein [Pseudomonas piscis]|uniref:hypothetical protein n=1 Tax=Pseudomonas piscis TaxID=2614538 RepID=UPI0021D59730|nr:hypothetical protein [Pseudomonas piscis]MCU7645634.1 hypothetical protein [Pseudomonas piscis]